VTEDVIRLLLVGPHADYRRVLAMLVGREPGLVVIGQAGSLAEARALLASGLETDVALVELALPDGHGAELVRELRRDHAEVRVLVLTASRDPRDHAQALTAGAAHVLAKLVGIPELVATIRRLQGGDRVMPAPGLVHLMQRLAEEQPQRVPS
jgi:two-component system, NarL family, response regulator DevR